MYASLKKLRIYLALSYTESDWYILTGYSLVTRIYIIMI